MPRPTLLIAFGGFGLDALQRLLHQSALRGVLRWKESQTGGVASAQHQLQDLGLLALPDPFERSPEVATQAAAGAPQFLTDLYRQIKEAPSEALSAEGGIARFVRRAADELVAQTAFDRRDPMGLDLLVLARPTSPETVAHLDILIQGCLESLADSAFFKTAVQGAENLNCILVLDFDDYWRTTGSPEEIATARDLRAALRNSMQSWERRRAQRQAALDRCYLMDGRTAVGYRPPHVRLDEAVLFLELLLFEDLRTQRQGLYQQQSLVQPIAATFGIRLLEESTMALSREAAATFGRRWLDALIGDEEQCPDRSARRLAETLEPYTPEAIERRIEDNRLEQRFEAGAEALAKAIAEVPDRQAVDWLGRVRELYERERQSLDQTLNRAGWELVSAIKEAHLEDLDQRVVAAVDADLHDERSPASLKLVRERIEVARAALTSGQAGPVPADTEDGDPLHRLALLHRRYREQLDEWLAGQGRALHWLWPLFALLLALGLAPLTARIVAQIRPPGPGWPGGALGGWLPARLGDALDRLVVAMHAANDPLVWTLVWFPILWAVCALLIQPRILDRIQRAQRFYTSAQRGRFSDYIRDLVAPLRASLLQRVRRNIRSSLNNDVQKTLSRIGDRLAERGREMDWLRRQLGEYLRLSIQPTTAVRKWVRAPDALQAMLEANPPVRDRVCYRQDALPRPFDGWNEHFCDAFLDPLRFIDVLSKPYADDYEQRQEKRNLADDLPERRRELIDFIDRSNLALACRFLQDTGVTDEQRWCIAAQRWKHIPGMADELNNRLGVVDSDIVPAADRSRVYLLMLQTGIDASRLERQPT